MPGIVILIAVSPAIFADALTTELKCALESIMSRQWTRQGCGCNVPRWPYPKRVVSNHERTRCYRWSGLPISGSPRSGVLLEPAERQAKCGRRREPAALERGRRPGGAGCHDVAREHRLGRLSSGYRPV